MKMPRRQFLISCLGHGALAVPALWLVGCDRNSEQKAKQRRAARSTDSAKRPTIADAVQRLKASKRADVLGTAAALVEKGLSHDQLRAALVEQWAGIDGDIHGGLALHALLAIERELAPRERLLALFRAVDHVAAHRDAWRPMDTLAPLPKRLLGLSLSELTTQLRTAFDALDGPKVRLYVRALHQRWGQEAVSAELLRMAARDDGFGGHSAHLIVAALDLLRTVKWHAAERVLDQVAYRLQPPGTWQAPPSKAAMTAYSRHRRLVSRAGEKWQQGVRQMAESRALRKIARTARGQELESQVRAALSRGVHPDALWDGLSLAAADMTLVDPSPAGTGVHALLLVAALRQAARRAPTPQARLVTLLGAAWRLPRHRPGQSAPAAPSSVTATEVNPLLITGARKRRADAIRRAAGNGGAKALAVRDGLRDVALKKAATNPHLLEVPVAATRLAAVAAPHFQGDILAASATCTPDPQGPDWSRLGEAQQLIAKLRGG
ncbi:MAG: hypothetical protein KC502_05435 [Myxococcales bacterium]|nr:hypothetical protein [Myxococcales bacterium]